jgi:cell filamentation protein
MVDKYGTGNDPDCYEGTKVLTNNLNITNQETLDEAERDISEACAVEIDFASPPYNIKYLCKIHKSLFSDIYSWAGVIRTIDISKGSTHFCHVPYIEKETNKLFTSLAKKNYFENLDKDKLIVAVAELYGDLNMTHPFREGNGRAQRILFEHIITNAGYEIYWNGIKQEEWITANIEAVSCNYKLLTNIFYRCIGNRLT